MLGTTDPPWPRNTPAGSATVLRLHYDRAPEHNLPWRGAAQDALGRESQNLGRYGKTPTGAKDAADTALAGSPCKLFDRDVRCSACIFSKWQSKLEDGPSALTVGRTNPAAMRLNDCLGH